MTGILFSAPAWCPPSPNMPKEHAHKDDQDILPSSAESLWAFGWRSQCMRDNCDLEVHALGRLHLHDSCSLPCLVIWHQCLVYPSRRTTRSSSEAVAPKHIYT